MNAKNEIKWELDGQVWEEHPPNKSVSTAHLRGANQKPTLEELQEAVGGSIQFAYNGKDAQIIIDEEGKFKGKPINMKATEYWFRLLESNNYKGYTLEEFIRKVDFLVGNVIILHRGAMLD